MNMIDLSQLQPDFTGKWFQGHANGDFKIFILEIRGNGFAGVKTDKNGIAFIEGQIFKDHTIFTKDYAMHVKETTNAAITTLVYGFPQNIFNLEKDQIVDGSWCFPKLPEGGKVTLTAHTAFGLGDFEPASGNVSKMLDILKGFESAVVENNSETSGSSDDVDDLPF